MIGRTLLLLLCAPLLGGHLLAAPSGRSADSLMYEIKESFQELEYKIKAHQIELDLLLERMNALDEKISDPKPLDGRLAKMESSQKALAADLKTLRQHLEETQNGLHKCQKQLSSLDKQMATDIQSLKSSLQSMIVLLKGGSAPGEYVVSDGDSLGKIAQKFHISTKALKECNHLKNDVIYVGQKLKIPS